MAFEIRLIDQGPVYGGEDPVAGRFADEEWWNFLSLAHECGFDPGEEYVPVVYPEGEGETNELGNKLMSGLYIGVNMVLNQDTLPFATTWDSDDGRLHFRWAGSPGYARDRRPEDGQGSREGSDESPGAGPGAGPDFALDEAELRRLRDYLGKGPMLVVRVAG
ncbi:MAG: hypothetical protein WA990_10705 [Rubrobacteraceae bacterium]